MLVAKSTVPTDIVDVSVPIATIFYSTSNTTDINASIATSFHSSNEHF
jgi:hypothetical protein